MGFQWPPYSPDLNPCDYYLWGHLKARVNEKAPQTVAELKTVIKQEVEKLDVRMLQQELCIE